MIARAAILGLSILTVSSGVSTADEEFLNVELPGVRSTQPDRVVSGTWSVECRMDLMEDYRYCFISQNLESNEFYSKRSDLSIRYNEGGKVYLWVGSGDRHPGTSQVIRIDGNKPHRARSDEPFVVDASLKSELASGSTIRTRWYEWPYEAKRDQELPLTGLGAVLDTVGRIVNGEKFTLPRESIYRFYWWEGTSYGSKLKQAKKSLNPDFEWSRCPLPDFDLEATAEAALRRLPGVAGQAFRAGFQSADDPILNLRQVDCRKVFSSLRDGPSIVEGLAYPD